MSADILEDLNPQQREAVIHQGTPLLIVAGAGSGKTRVLTRRIAHLLQQRSIAPWEILAITFTNKAAGEMKERVAELVGPRSKNMWVATFHSACVRILRNEIEHLGYSRQFTIYDSADSLRLITMVMRDLNLDSKRYVPRAFQGAISRAKNELLGPADYRNSTQNWKR
jgi:DNA helicase-2/ATP-dependent DNA helicase PcrA